MLDKLLGKNCSRSAIGKSFFSRSQASVLVGMSNPVFRKKQLIELVWEELRLDFGVTVDSDSGCVVEIYPFGAGFGSVRVGDELCAVGSEKMEENVEIPVGAGIFPPMIGLGSGAPRAGVPGPGSSSRAGSKAGVIEQGVGVPAGNNSEHLSPRFTFWRAAEKWDEQQHIKGREFTVYMSFVESGLRFGDLNSDDAVPGGVARNAKNPDPAKDTSVVRLQYGKCASVGGVRYGDELVGVMQRDATSPTGMRAVNMADFWAGIGSRTGKSSLQLPAFQNLQSAGEGGGPWTLPPEHESLLDAKLMFVFLRPRAATHPGVGSDLPGGDRAGFELAVDERE